MHLKLPYNTKADVYSFAMLAYKVLGRTLVSNTCIAENTKVGARAGERAVQKYMYMYM